MVVYAFNPSTWEAEAGGSQFEASLVYIVSFRTTRAVTKRNPVLKNKQTNKQTNPSDIFHKDRFHK